MAKPLNGKNIVITRDHSQSIELIREINNLGGRCESFPTINIVPPSNWQKCDALIAKLDEFDWIIFSSTNAVKFFIQRIIENKINTYSGKVGAIGRQTEKILRSYNWSVDLVPDCFSARGLVEQFNNVDIAGKKILLPCSEIAQKDLQEGLEGLGAKVQRTTVYRTICASGSNADHIAQGIHKKKIDAILFFSPSAVSCFYKIMTVATINTIVQNKIAIGAIGNTTANSLNKIGLLTNIVPKESTQHCLIDTLVVYFNKV